MNLARSLTPPDPRPRRHASAEEYSEFLRGHGVNAATTRNYLQVRERFVGIYPDPEDWFRAPLAERVGRLPGEGRAGMTSRLSYKARSYLYFLALRGYAWFDREWLVAMERLHVWGYLAYTSLGGAADQLVDEAVRLGYNRLASSQGVKWVLSRIYLHTLNPDIAAVGEPQLDALAEAIRSFSERPDRHLFFGSEDGYRNAAKGYGTNLHLLRVLLFHRGQIASEPRKVMPLYASRPTLKPRMEAVVGHYLEERRRLDSRPATVVRLDLTLRRFIGWLACEHPDLESFAEVTREHVLGFARSLDEEKNRRTGRPLAPLTKRGRMSNLSVFFQDVSSWGWEGVPDRPLLGSGDLPKMPERVPRYIPEEELGRLMEAIRLLDCPYQRAALLIARWSGARRDEIRRLELGCLDYYADGTPRLRIPAGKTRQERMVPLVEEAAEAIREIQALHAGGRGFRDEQTGEVKRCLFLNHGKRYSTYYLFTVALRKACEAAGLVTSDGQPGVTPHRFRHTVGHQLAERGAKIQTIMSVLGHSSAQMSMVYARISDREVLREYQKVLGPGATIAGPLAETLRKGELPQSSVEWLKSNFFKTELELGHCLRLPQEGPCECDLYLSCTKFVTTPEYAPRLRARRKRERDLIEDAISNGWEREVERHRCTIKRLDQLLLEMGEPVEGTRESG